MDRTAVATQAGTVMFAVDGSPGKAYAPTGWELCAALVPLQDSGQYAELVAQLARVIDANPHYPMLVYNLACAESVSGQTGDAIEHREQAVEAEEKFRDDARVERTLIPCAKSRHSWR